MEVGPSQAVSYPPFLPLVDLCSPQEKAMSLPSDVAQDLHGVEAQLRRQEGLERELALLEQQVSRWAASPP